MQVRLVYWICKWVIYLNERSGVYKNIVPDKWETNVFNALIEYKSSRKCIS